MDKEAGLSVDSVKQETVLGADEDAGGGAKDWRNSLYPIGESWVKTKAAW